MIRNFPAFIAGMAMFIVAPAFSQLRYGPHFGTTFTSFASDNTGFSGNLGLVVGGTVEYDLTSAAQLFANLDYNQIRGGLNSPPTMIGNTTIVENNVFTLHAAEASLLASYRFPIPFFGSATPKLVGGGSVAYNFYTNAQRNVSFYSNDSRSSISGSENVTDSFEPFLYSVQGGLQFEFLLSDAHITAVSFDIRYRRNINAVMSGLSLYGQGGASDVYANSLIITFGFRFK